MGQLIASVFVTIDGMVADSRDEMMWALKTYDEEMYQELENEQRQTGMMIFGGKTYRILSDFWQDYPATSPIGRMMAETPKLVFSRTLTHVSWKNTTIIRSISREVILKLKASTDKLITVVGSANVLQQLADLGLIDEYRLCLFPVILGNGIPLFSPLVSRSRNLELTSARILKSGIVALRYQTAKVESFGNKIT